MSYRFTVINAYRAFMKESESEVLKIEESESNFCVPTAQPCYIVH
jgi:hypothetical protein